MAHVLHAAMATYCSSRHDRGMEPRFDESVAVGLPPSLLLSTARQYITTSIGSKLRAYSHINDDNKAHDLLPRFLPFSIS